MIMPFRYALIRADAVAEIRSFEVALDLAEVKHQNGRPMLRPITRVSPPFDPASQVRSGPVYTINPANVVETFAVRAKSQGEIDAEDISIVAQLPATFLFEILYDLDSRLRTLEGGPSKTRQEFSGILLARFRAKAQF